MRSGGGAAAAQRRRSGDGGGADGTAPRAHPRRRQKPRPRHPNEGVTGARSSGRIDGPLDAALDLGLDHFEVQAGLVERAGQLGACGRWRRRWWREPG